jgi:hypothetical protein
MTLNEFKEKFQKIKEIGFIKTKRKGPTGIGYTFEELLGIKENNIAGPDIENIEIKTHRINSNNLITLFTFNNKVWKMNPLEAIRQYGTPDKNGRLGLYFTMSQKPNSQGLYIYITDEEIQLRHIDGTIIAVWNINNLVDRFNQKIPALLFITAEVEVIDGVEWFHYIRAQLLRGTSKEILLSQFKEENIVIDLRLHDKGTRARNHGTGFRCYESALPKIFKEVIDI